MTLSFTDRYNKATRENGDVFAAIGYLMASVILMFSSMKIDMILDGSAGAIWFFADLIIVMMKLLETNEVTRTRLLFSASSLGGMFFTAGAINRIISYQTNWEAFEAISQFISGTLIVIAALGALTGYIKIPGRIYLIAFSFALLFSIVQLFNDLQIATFGYVLAAILWLWASDCIKRKFG